MIASRPCRRPALDLRAAALGFLLAASPVWAWQFEGAHSIKLHPRVGDPVGIGTVEFRPQGDRYGFTVKLDHERFKDFFLSMREFKCLEGDGEIQCHVPYPYRQPASVTPSDLSWLEHSLLFLFKSPREFGAKLWNGLYYRLEAGPTGLTGYPQAVDLNQIGAPPSNLDIPPFGPSERSEIPAGTRWFGKITIE